MNRFWGYAPSLNHCFKQFCIPRNVFPKRTFLSESYSCREAWEKRLESSLLKKVNTRKLFQELDAQFSHFGRASAIDVDIFINASTRDAYIEDIESVLTLLRLCPDSGFMLPSTHHGVVRLLLDANRTETILKIISNRLKYGIFPDHYCCNLLMDTFLKAKQYAAAARVGVSLMLQEDWENLLTTRLSVYSCHMFLKHSEQPWYSEDEVVTPPPEPKEVVKVRVKYLRNPFFDDHFDLQDPKLLVGKTLAMFSSKFGASPKLSSSYLLLGLTLHEKFDQVINLIHTLSNDKTSIYREAIQLAKSSLNIDQGGKHQEVNTLLNELEPLASKDDMVLEMESLVKEAVQQQEVGDIEKQVKLYSQWEDDRISALKAQQEEIRKEETLKKISDLKAKLVEEEREVFFFDNEDKIELLIEEREKQLASLDWLKEKKKSSKQLREEADAAYVPPEVHKRHSP